MLRRYLPLWVGIAIFGLAIGLPLGWGFSQFHSSDMHQSPERGLSGSTPETFWERFRTDPTAFGAIVLCGVTAILAAYTALLWGATGRLVKGADETAKRQLRAYIVVKKAALEAVEIGKPIVVRVKFINAGQTPAKSLIVTANLESIPLPAESLERDVRSFPSQPRASIGPGIGLKAKLQLSLPVTQADMDAFRAGKLVLALYGAVAYVDIFGDKQTTPIFMVTAIDDLRRGIFRLIHSDNGNDPT